jgi:hypothetical protein
MRPLSLVLADAFDRAAHDVFVAPQVAAAVGEPVLSRWAVWVIWCRGFVAGFTADGISLPLSKRVVRWLMSSLGSTGRRALSRLSPCENQEARR